MDPNSGRIELPEIAGADLEEGTRDNRGGGANHGNGFKNMQRKGGIKTGAKKRAEKAKKKPEDEDSERWERERELEREEKKQRGKGREPFLAICLTSN